MTELKGVESDQATGVTPDPRSKFFIFADRNVDIKAGDEVLLMIIKSAALKNEEYGLPLRLTDKAEPDEDEFVVQYGDKLFVAQKIPDFI